MLPTPPIWDIDMICSKCAAEIADTSRFCNECGCPQMMAQSHLLDPFKEPKSYTPKFLAEKILTSKSVIEGERKLVTVLFADVANFTSISEKLDPEEVHQVMDGCFQILMDEIHSCEGTINQFTGDGVMALFGAPVAHEDHAQKACNAALSIQNALQDYSKFLNDKFNIIFKLRIGLNSGSVVVGSIGNDLRMDYTAIGDTTNLAARLESLAKPGTILVSKNTYKNVRSNFVLDFFGKFEIKGKEAAQEAYELRRRFDRAQIEFTRKIYSEMVGREKELNRLEFQVRKAIKGEGSIVNVIGEAGIGKSRLIAELKQKDVVKKVALREGRSISMGKGLSFYPVIDIYKNWAKIKEDESDAIAIEKLRNSIRSVAPKDTDEMLPFIATLMGIKLTGRYAERVKEIEGEALEKLILKNVKDLLIKSSELIPLVIVIEDLHWADLSTIELLESIFRLAEKHRILFINVFRPRYTETGVRIVKVVRGSFPDLYIEIELQPLNEQMSEKLINNMLKISDLPHSVRDKIVKRAGGNPFFIEEVVRSFIDDSVILRKKGGFEVSDKIDSVVIPQTINDVLIARIDRLEDKTRELVKTASVIGRSFFHRILTEIVTTIENIDNRLKYLTEIQLIRNQIRMGELEHIFKHALTQEAAYTSLLAQKRKELHLIVAQTIENIFEDRLYDFYGMLAYHYSKGEDFEKAEEYMTKAGEEALRSSASSEALNYYQDALKLYLKKHGDNTDPEKLVNFEKNIALALYNKAQWSEAVKYIDSVLERWGAPLPKKGIAGNVRLIRDLLVIMKVVYMRMPSSKKKLRDQDREILELYYKAAIALIWIDPIRQFQVAMATLRLTTKFDIFSIPKASRYWVAASSEFSVGGISFSLSNRMLQIAHRLRDTEDFGERMHSTFIHHCQGVWGKIKELDEDLMNSSLRIGNCYDTSMYLWAYGLVKGEQGEFGLLMVTIDRLYEIGETYDYDLARIHARLLKAFYLVKAQAAKEALAEAERGISESREKSTELHELMFLGFKAEAHQLAGDGKAFDSLSQASKIYERQPSVVMPIFVTPFMVADFFVGVEQLKHTIRSETSSELALLRKNAYEAGKAAVRNSHKYAPYRTKILRLMGLYYWLIEKQDKAVKWWRRAIEEGKRLNARPDLARTYMEIGKRFLEEKSKYKELNGINVDKYVHMAKELFVEMDLQWDLDELEKLN